MKKLFTLFVVVICVMNASANEPDFQVGDFYYKVISSNEVELVNPSSEIGWHSTSLHSPNEYSDLTVANIPADVEYDGSIYNVTTIEKYAFHDSDDLREITIPWTMTNIGDMAFSGCMIIRDKFINYSTLDAAWNNYWGATLLDEVDGLLINYLENVVVKCITDAANVTIPEGLTVIADGAFQECTKLTNITIPNSITYIGYEAFRNCSSLTSITIPNSVTSIGSWAFGGCSSLTSITIPNSVTSIGDGAFSYCSSLTSVTIPNSITSIGYSAFYGCASLSSITIPENVEEIMSNAFGDCWFTEANFVNNSNLNAEENHYWGARFFDQEIGGLLIENDTLVGARNYITIANIPEIVKVIVGNVFYNCKQLVSITIPNSVTDIYSWAFYGCSIVRNNFVNHSSLNAQENDYWGALIADVEIDGLLIRNDTVMDCRENVTSVTIPNSVTSIGNSAFSDCSSLTSVTIPNSVTSIGDEAFYYCTSLTSITIPNSVTSIGKSAFLSGNSLTSIILTGSTIESFCQSTTNKQLYNAGAYYNRKIELNNQEINDLIIPNSVTSIEDYAFYNCSSLASVTIPNSVTSIGEWAFSNCSSLDTIYVEASTPPAFGVEVFTNAPISTCYIPCLTTAAYEASDWAQYMGEFVEDYEQCGDSLYWKYKDTQLSIMGYGDMYDYDIKAQSWQQYRNKMQTTSLPEGLTSIGAAAFADCKFLKNATIPSSVKEIRYSAFEDCRSLSSLTFVEPSALTSIGNWAFYNCHKLQHVTIPDGVTEIGEAAFFDCTYLDELTLPASMEYIADNGFALCAKLRRMNVNATTPPQVEARTFEDVDRTIPVVVPDESVSVYKSAPVWQEFNIVGKSGVPAALDNIPAENSATRKLLRDGNLVIIRDGVEYNVMGQEL